MTAHQPGTPAPRRRRLGYLLIPLGVVAVLVGGVALISPQQLWGPAGALNPSPSASSPSSSSPSASSPSSSSAPTSPVATSSPPATPSSPSATATPPSSAPTSTPSASPTLKPSPPADSGYELPVEGSTGFVTVKTKLKAVGDLPGGTLRPGQSFTVTKDEGKTWLVSSGKAAGRLAVDTVMINLPDLIPSIVYTDVNGDAAIFTSSGVRLPGVTGKRLYTSKAFNAKLGIREYFMPVLFPMAKKIQAMQQAALARDETLILYQAFRPHTAQRKVSLALLDLHKNNKRVRAGIDRSGWGVSSFIALNLSSHQLGTAIDVSLGTVTGTRTMQGHDYSYTEVEAAEYEMQTPMHELSTASSTYTHPVRTKTGTAWKKAPLNPAMTKAAKRLQQYAVGAGLTPLASEWWHFDDWDARKHIAGGSNGHYLLQLPKQ